MDGRGIIIEKVKSPSSFVSKLLIVVPFGHTSAHSLLLNSLPVQQYFEGNLPAFSPKPPQCSIARAAATMPNRFMSLHIARPTSPESPKRYESSASQLPSTDLASRSLHASSYGHRKVAISQTGGAFGRRDRATQNVRIHRRRRFNSRERLEVAAVRKAGACESCRDKHIKCRHTTSAPSEVSIRTATSQTRTVASYQTPETSASHAASSPGYPRADRPLQPIHSQPEHQNARIAHYVSDPEAPNPFPAYNNEYMTSLDRRRHLVTNAIANTNHHFPINPPLNRPVNPFVTELLGGGFDKSGSMFTMAPALDPAMPWNSEWDPSSGYSLDQPLHDPIDYTGTQFNRPFDQLLFQDPRLSSTENNSVAAGGSASPFYNHQMYDGRTGHSHESLVGRNNLSYSLQYMQNVFDNINFGVVNVDFDNTDVHFSDLAEDADELTANFDNINVNTDNNNLNSNEVDADFDDVNFDDVEANTAASSSEYGLPYE